MDITKMMDIKNWNKVYVKTVDGKETDILLRANYDYYHIKYDPDTRHFTIHCTVGTAINIDLGLGITTGHSLMKCAFYQITQNIIAIDDYKGMEDIINAYLNRNTDA